MTQTINWFWIFWFVCIIFASSSTQGKAESVEAAATSDAGHTIYKLKEVPKKVLEKNERYQFISFSHLLTSTWTNPDRIIAIIDWGNLHQLFMPIAHFLIPEAEAQSGEEEVIWPSDIDIPVLIPEAEAQSDDEVIWPSDIDILEELASRIGDVGQFLTFRIDARVSANYRSVDPPISGNFSIRIVPLRNSATSGSVGGQIGDAAGGSSGSVEGPIGDVLDAIGPAILTGHELSVGADASYLPFRGETQHAASGESYSWESLVNRSELVSWSENIDNEQSTLGTSPLGVNEELSLTREATIRGAVAQAEVVVTIRPSESEFRVDGSVSLRSDNAGGRDLFASAEADLVISVSLRQPVWVRVTNCDLFVESFFEYQKVEEFTNSGGVCSFKVSGTNDLAKMDDSEVLGNQLNIIPYPEDIIPYPEDGQEGCAVAMRGTGNSVIGSLVTVEAIQRIPDTPFYDQTERTQELIENETALGMSEFADADFQRLAAIAAERLANHIETYLILEFEGDGVAEGIQSVTIRSQSGHSESFKLNFDEMESLDDVNAFIRHVVTTIEQYIKGCLAQKR